MMNNDYTPSPGTHATTRDTDYPRCATIVDLVSQQARRTPDMFAVESSRNTLTYAELDEESGRLAGYLRRNGVKDGDFVAVAVERNSGQIVALLATLKVGAAYVPMDTGNPPARSSFILEDAGVKLVITDENSMSVVQDFNGRRLFIDRESSAIAATNMFCSQSQSATDPAYLNYTSGSTGTPKGVVIPHRAVTRLVCATNYVQLIPGDRVLQGSNIAFDAATFEIWGALINGATIVTVPRDTTLNPEAYSNFVQSRQISVAFVTTALFNQLARTQPDVFAGMRAVLFGGEAVDPRWVREVLHAAPPRRLLHVYGPTEGTTFSSWYEVTSVPEGADTIPIGHAVANTRLAVMNPEGSPVAPGSAGELYISGDGLATGYWRRPDLTREKFVTVSLSPDSEVRYYRTGDRVRALPNGAIEFLGRFDNQVKIRGFRIELDEISATLLKTGLVRDATVLCREDKRGEKRIVAYVTPGGQGAPAPTQLRDQLAVSLPPYMVPNAFVVLDTLPLNRVGKVDRQALPIPGRSAYPGEETLRVAESDQEHALVHILKRLFNLDKVGLNDSFYDLGGHSLLATQLAIRIHEAFGVNLDVDEIFDNPVFSALLELVTARQGSGKGKPGLTIPRAERSTTIPLSSSQERVWFLQKLAPTNIAYHFQCAMSLEGDLDIPSLNSALSDVIARHEIFRTTFPGDDGTPRQVIHKPFAVQLPLDDLSDLPPDEQQGRLEEILNHEFRTPFDLDQLPLVRWRLVRLSPQSHILAHVEHHLVHDGWSYNVFLGDLLKLYRSHVTGQQENLPENPIQFADYAIWQQQWLHSPEAASQLQYWKDELTGSPELSSFPTDRPRQLRHDFKGNALRLELPPELYASLTSFCRSHNVTLFNLMLTALSELLRRYSGQDDVSLGVGIASRRCKETEALIGMVINNVVIRTQADRNQSVVDALQVTSNKLVQASKNQDIPFDRVVKATGVNRALSHNPLFQLLISIHDAPLPEDQFPGLEGRLKLGINNGSAKFDMVLTLIPVASEIIGAHQEEKGLTIVWEYSTALYDEITIRGLYDQYCLFLERMVATPDVPVVSIPLIPDETARQAQSLVNDTAREWTGHRFVDEYVHEYAMQCPDKTAVEFGQSSLGYAELNRRIQLLATRLAQIPASEDRLIGVSVSRSLDLVVSVLAIHRSGHAYVPLDPEYPAQRLRWIAEHSGVAVVLSDDAGCTERFGPDVECIAINEVDWSTGAVGDLPPIDRNDKDLAYIIYTSGSTGLPKGVAVEHRSLNNLLHSVAERPGLTSNDRFLAVTTLSFDISALELLLPLMVGATLIIASGEEVMDGRLLGRRIAQSRVTVMQGTPSTWQLLLEGGWSSEAGLTCWCGGERLARDLANRLLAANCELWNMYGPTETTIWSSAGRVGSDGTTISVGLPLANTSMYVLDEELRPVPRNVRGQLCIGGAGLARGYHRDPEQTSKRFIALSDYGAGRFYMTGDSARLLSDGSFEVTGRLDDQVKVRGHRIELGELETVLCQHERVTEAAARVWDSSRYGARLAAYVVPNAGLDDGLESQHPDHETSGTIEQVLLNYIKTRLPAYMVPSGIQVLDTLPRTPNGKLDRRALPEMAALNPALEMPSAPPRTDTERTMADIWSEVLAVAVTDVNRSFFELGGQSLMAARVVALVFRRFSVEIPVYAIFTSPTIEEQAALVDTALAASTSVQAPERIRGEL